MNTGVVMRLENGKAVVLGAGGQFLRLRAKNGWQVGDTVAFKKPVAKKKLWYGLTAVAACFVLALGLAYGGMQPAVFQPSSVIGIDINPSIELRLDKKGNVAEAVGYNLEGKVIVQQVGLEGMPYRQAVEALFASPQMQPYLEQKEYINFSVSSGERAEEILEFIQQAAAEVTRSHPQMKTACEHVEEKVAQQARQHGMTPGKMRAIIELQQLDPNATVDEYADDELSEINRCIEAHRHKGGQGNQNGQGGQQAYQEEQKGSQSGQQIRQGEQQGSQSRQQIHQGEQPNSAPCAPESRNMYGVGENRQEAGPQSDAAGQGKQHGKNDG